MRGLHIHVALLHNNITVDPNIFGGKPCIRGLRFPVSRILGLLAAGETKESILKAYPYLEAEVIDEALAYAVTMEAIYGKNRDR